MKFDFYKGTTGYNVFSAMISDAEIANLNQSNSIMRRFINSMLNRMAMQIAGYYFKKHKDEFAAFITTDECKDMIAKHLANKIKVEIE